MDSFDFGNGAFAHGGGDAGVAILRAFDTFAFENGQGQLLVGFENIDTFDQPSTNFSKRSRFVFSSCVGTT